MRDLQIYLGGKMAGLNTEEMNEWRQQFIKIISPCAENYNVKLTCVNPCKYYNFEEIRYQSQMEVMKFDLAKVWQSDILVVNIDGLSTSIGTIIECYDAWDSGIPVLAFGDKDSYKNLHPWIKNCITRCDPSMLETIEYIKDFYMSQVVRYTNGLTTTHSLARELLSKPDGFLVVSDGEQEYVVDSVRRAATHANLDDYLTHWVLNIRQCFGNIIR